VWYANSLALFCGLCFALAVAAGIGLFQFLTGKQVFSWDVGFTALYGLPMLLAFAGVSFPLLGIVQNARRYFDQQIETIKPPHKLKEAEEERGG
jgi:hypothetical protein